MELTFENLLAHINTVYILLTKSDQQQRGAMSSSSSSAVAWTHHINDDVQDQSLRLKVISIINLIDWISS